MHPKMNPGVVVFNAIVVKRSRNRNRGHVKGQTERGTVHFINLFIPQQSGLLNHFNNLGWAQASLFMTSTMRLKVHGFDFASIMPC